MVDETVRSDIEAVNARKGGRFRIAVVDPRQIELLEKNARYMTREQFQNLVENIKRDGDLSSTPFCVKRADGRFVVLSGNHRVKAAIAADLETIVVLFTDEDLGHESEVAIQIAHNAIAGQDDLAILKDLWSELEDLQLKYYSGLDDKRIGELESLAGSGIAPVRLDYRSVTFLMLPEETEHLDQCIELALQQTGAADERYVVMLRDADRLLEAVGRVQKQHNVKNAAVAISLILDVFEKAVAEAGDGDGEAVGSTDRSDSSSV